MSNYESEEDKIRNRIVELEKRHRKLDNDIEILYNNITISEEVRRMHEMDSFSMGSSDKNGHTTIRREFKNFYHFLKGGNDSMSGVRRETMFINILEGLHPLEAEIICLCKDKKLSDRYKITKEIVSEAYPDITWGNRS